MDNSYYQPVILSQARLNSPDENSGKQEEPIPAQDVEAASNVALNSAQPITNAQIDQETQTQVMPEQPPSPTVVPPSMPQGEENKSDGAMANGEVKEEDSSAQQIPAVTPETPAMQTAQPSQASDAPTPEATEAEDDPTEIIKRGKEKIISDLNLGQASEEQRDKILSTLDQRMSITITQAIIENCNDEEAQKIKEAIEDEEKLEKVVSEIVSANPALVEKIKAKTQELYQKILSESQQVFN